MTQGEHSIAFTRKSTVTRFGASIEGSVEALFLVVATQSLGTASRDALSKSATALGWAAGPTYLFVDAPTLATKADLYEAIEGLDPLVVVLAGREAQSLAEEAYGSAVSAEGRFRLFGRHACSFEDLDSLLASESGKQKVWALLKTLPTAPQ